MGNLKILFILICNLTLSVAIAQTKDKKVNAYTITYQRMENGKFMPDNEIKINYQEHITEITNQTKNESYFIDYQNKEAIKIIFSSGTAYKAVTPFDSLPKAIETNETETILGYQCKKIKYSIFSNTIEVWYTTEAQAKGSPSLSYIPENGLVLKSVMNGNRIMRAKAIEKLKTPIKFNYPLEAPVITESKYRALQILSKYTAIKIFNKQQINFENDIKNPSEEILDSTYRFSQGNILMKKIKLPEIKTGGNVFVRLINWSNGDAYDRTGCVFTFSSKKEKTMLDALKKGLNELPVMIGNKGEKFQGVTITNNYTPPIELMRFFTSFGVSYFNNKRPIDGYHWADSVVYKQEVTELIPAGEKEMWFGVFIGNYDKGGHQVSLDLMYYPPEEETKPKENFILPLFHTLNVMEASGQNYGKMFKDDTLRTEFELPEGIENLKMLYTTTGHGGWEGGDEFNPKMNRVLIDGVEVFKHVPWRTDCATYRISNPASGNFGNGMSSSDYSRSNWCPATLTPPYHIPLTSLKPGKHIVEVIIDQGDNEGGSFSHWSVSGILTGNLTK